MKTICPKCYPQGRNAAYSVDMFKVPGYKYWYCGACGTSMTPEELAAAQRSTTVQSNTEQRESAGKG